MIVAVEIFAVVAIFCAFCACAIILSCDDKER